MTWIPLHVHSHWSLLDGVPSISELVDFVVRCRKASIQPTIGAKF